ncbi:MAG TPA: glycosyltransferase [Thermoanaerobaculales bacterium]|nr:glycosyltransferase [Thermoanaerobaculales bacterium]
MASLTECAGDPQVEPPPLVTVLTPAYNRAGLLPETIESVLDQDYPSFEYVLLDDGSTDETPEVAARYAGRVRYLRHDNLGEARTVNRGLEEARGELIAVVNSDDPVRPGFLSAMVAALAAHPEAVVAYPDWELIDRDSRVVEVRHAPEHDFERMVAANWCYIGPGAVFRRRLVERIGGRDPSYRQVGDLDFWLRAGLHGPFVHVPRALATWRSHPGSTSVADVSDEKVAEYVRVMERFFEQPGMGPELLRLRPQALAMAHHIAALKTMWRRRPLARRHLARSLRLHPTLRSRHPSHPRSLKIILRTFLLPQALDRALLTRWMRLRYGRQPSI